ncbi:MAG: OpgC domain-containing protein, partial [Pseudomonadota bacterium]
MSDVKTPVRAPSVRDPRLDVFRGICLVMIFINHVPGNLYEEWTSRNFGFSDAAEGFVLMSGVAAGLAYSMDFRGFSRFWTGLARVWRRVWTLYLVHILTTVLALGAASAVAVWLNDS